MHPEGIAEQNLRKNGQFYAAPKKPLHICYNIMDLLCPFDGMERTRMPRCGPASSRRYFSTFHQPSGERTMTKKLLTAVLILLCCLIPAAPALSANPDPYKQPERLNNNRELIFNGGETFLPVSGANESTYETPATAPLHAVRSMRTARSSRCRSCRLCPRPVTNPVPACCWQRASSALPACLRSPRRTGSAGQYDSAPRQIRLRKQSTQKEPPVQSANASVQAVFPCRPPPLPHPRERQ